MAALTIRIWDLPTRLFHWTLAVLVTGSIVTIKVGGNWVEWHFRCGYAILTLLLFRVVWGFIGPRYARFTQFLKSPLAILEYARALARGRHNPAPGHNPLGGLSVIALLACLLFQATSGLFSNDDVASEGPLAPWVSKQTSDLVSSLHSANATLIYILLGLHLVAIAFYLLRFRRNLVAPMITGRLPLPEDTSRQPQPWLATQDGFRVCARAALVLAACAILVWMVVSNVPPQVGS